MYELKANKLKQTNELKIKLYNLSKKKKIKTYLNMHYQKLI